MFSHNATTEFMRTGHGSLPTPDALMVALIEQKKLLEKKDKALDQKSAEIKNQQALINVLEEKLRLMNQRKFGTSSETNVLQEDWLADEAEALADGQPDPDDGESDNPEDKADDEKSPRKPRPRKDFSPHLPRTQKYIHLSDEEREGAIDTFFVKVKEELDIIPAKVQVIEIMQEKAVYLDEEGERSVKSAVRPAHPIGKSVASINLLAWLVIAKYCDGSVPRVRGSKGLEIVRNFTNDEGLAPRSRLAGAGFKPLQAAGVKSLGGERCSKRCGIDRIRWDSERRTQVNRYCRVIRYSDDVETGSLPLTRDEGRGKPAEYSTGIWHKGGVTHCQALVRNEGTCRPDAKGAAQLDSLQESQSTDAGHRGGDSRSRVEGSVMELDQRGIVVQFRCEHNSRGDDVHS